MPRRPRRADALRNCERVLAAAWELLADDPASWPSVAEVAERAEVAVATVYRFFPTRALLYAAAFAHHLCDEVTPVVASLADHDPVEGLRRLSRAQVDVAAPWVELLATASHPVHSPARPHPLWSPRRPGWNVLPDTPGVSWQDVPPCGGGTGQARDEGVAEALRWAAMLSSAGRGSAPAP